MCIAFWKLSEGGGSHGCRDFVLAFNRDEFLDRPTKGFHAWPRHPNIYAPQDLKPPDESHRGSWLGVSRQGRLALLTNFREAVPHHDGKISRGALVRDFLLDQPVTPGGQEIEGEEVTVEYARRVFEERQKYDGFNLVLFDLRPGRRQAVYVTNRGSEVGPDGTPGSLKVLSAGEVVGLSNSTIDNPWPKVLKGKRAVTQVLEDTQDGEIGDQTSDSADEQLISSLLSIMR
ncbi:hypothetical protein GQ54DRAFT_144474 [Martensiomyces pterosporus]|nr:hypothetical protein GQ54DRAFT_144474 [Martensiomyces pterosporus]